MSSYSANAEPGFFGDKTDRSLCIEAAQLSSNPTLFTVQDVGFSCLPCKMTCHAASPQKSPHGLGIPRHPFPSLSGNLVSRETPFPAFTTQFDQPPGFLHNQLFSTSVSHRQALCYLNVGLKESIGSALEEQTPSWRLCNLNPKSLAPDEH